MLILGWENQKIAPGHIYRCKWLAMRAKRWNEITRRVMPARRLVLSGSFFSLRRWDQSNFTEHRIDDGSFSRPHPTGRILMRRVMFSAGSNIPSLCGREGKLFPAMKLRCPNRQGGRTHAYFSDLS